ncbi:MAG: hypothetical protein MK186_08060 [Henriciella sp.]|nr:hypothetical protein [Henriciella sp.]
MGYSDEVEGAVTAVVKRQSKSVSRAIWQIETAAVEKPIECTFGHPFLTADGWRWAFRLKAGDILPAFSPDKGFYENEVVKITRVKRAENVYSLIASRPNNYMIEGAICHSFGIFRRLRSRIENRMNGDQYIGYLSSDHL